MILLIANSDVDKVRTIRYLISWETYHFEEIYTAHSEKKAEQIVKTKRPDLVICDIAFVLNQENDWLNQYKENHPLAEVIVTAEKLEKEAFRRVLHLGAMDYLEIPVDETELENVLRRYQKKYQGKQSMAQDIQGGKYWKQNYALVQEMFWKNLCLNRISGNPEQIEEAASQFNVKFDKDSYQKMILLTMKNQDEMWSLWGEHFCQAAIQNIARAVVKAPEESSKVIIIYSRIAILIEQKEFSAAEDKCKVLIQRCKEELNAEVRCYISEPVFCERLAEVYSTLLAYSKDDVLKQQPITMVKDRNKKDISELIIPKTWEDIMYTSEPLKLVSEVRAFLIEAAHRNQLNEQNFRIFQQDMLQLFFSYMEKKEISAHELYDNNKIFKLYKTAVLSIDGMCQWVETCTAYIAQQNYGTGERPGESMVFAMKEYIRNHLNEKITIRQIAESIHLSPDYVSRVFKQETGLTLKEYIVKKRMKCAKYLLSTTKHTVSDIAAETGYDNLSYFIRQFQKYYGMTPKQYQMQDS